MSGFNHNNSSLRICVDRAFAQTVSGRVFSQRLTKPIPFADLSSLVLRLEDVFRQQNFPQAFQRSRTFLRDEKEDSFAAGEPSQGMGAEQVGAQRGELATFEVLVLGRRSSSWQGTVDWLDGGARQEFASFLELLRLVNERFFENTL